MIKYGLACITIHLPIRPPLFFRLGSLLVLYRNIYFVASRSSTMVKPELGLTITQYGNPLFASTDSDGNPLFAPTDSGRESPICNPGSALDLSVTLLHI